MAGTQEGNRKVAADMRLKFGLDSDGKSRFHKRIGSKGAEVQEGYLAMLKRTDPEKLKEISAKGVKAREARTDQTQGQ